jgi:endogenous inhibitor of DNA gyrase (YacG/DUF329 family)
MIPEGRISTTPTPYRVHCPLCGPIYLTQQEYERQMWLADSLWQCPECGSSATWDDDNYEQLIDSTYDA